MNLKQPHVISFGSFSQIISQHIGFHLKKIICIFSFFTFFGSLNAQSYMTAYNNSTTCSVQVWCIENCSSPYINNIGLIPPGGSKTWITPFCRATVKLVPEGHSSLSSTVYDQVTCYGSPGEDRSGVCTGYTLIANPSCGSIYDCSALQANIGDSCNDGNSNTINDQVNSNCQCVGTPHYDCSALQANIGDSCNDGNSNTINDQVNSNCQCVGTPHYDCSALQANIGDSCNDGNSNTINDQVNSNCQCVGTPHYDCSALQANIGDSCNDGNSNTINDQVNSNCQCVGTPHYDCSALQANIGDSCNDGNSNTINDQVNSNCQCVGIQQLASVGNLVWNDLDRDGQKDANEPGISGVTVKLQSPNGATLSTTTTNANGIYVFTNLDAGDYKIMFNTPNGLNPTARTGFGDNNIDNNNDNNAATGMTDVFSLSPGENNLTIDAGFVAPPAKASVGNLVWNDLNNDGQKDTNEPGISDVTVKLQNPNGTTLKTTKTDNNGFYSFVDLDAGKYKIMFNTPNGLDPTTRTGFGDNNQDNNNDNNAATGMTDIFSLSPGENNLTIDAGFVAQNVCDNLTFGGKIGFDAICAGSTEICGSGSGPNIESCELPSGGSGTIEYIWLKNEISCDGPTGTIAQMLANPDAYNWKIIPNSGSPTIATGTLTTSTCYLRCARRKGCDLYIGESNIVRIEVNPNCGGNSGGTTTESCGNGTSISYGNGSIKMDGGSYYKIFDANWQEVYNCGWECGNSKTVTGLPNGDYRVIIKNSNYHAICEKVITLTNNGNTGGGDPDNDSDGVPASQDCNDNDANVTTVGASCDDGDATTTNDAVLENCTCAGTTTSTGGGNTEGTTTESCDNGTSITYGNGSIKMDGGSYYTIFDANWQEIYSCGWECGNSKTVTGLANGDYRVIIKNDNYDAICEKVITLTNNGNTGGGDPDNDGDGVPASQDCNDNDANVTNVGASCNDGDEHTTNDVVLENCTCAGTTTSTGGGNTEGTTTESCDNGTSITYGNGSIKMDGGSYYTIFDANWQEVYSCGWECGNSKTVTGLANGDYRVIIKNDNYHAICEKVITLSNNNGNTGGSNIGGGNTGGLTVACGETTITNDGGTVDIQGISGKEYFFKIHDMNNGWIQVSGCGWNCGDQHTAKELANSKYLVSVYNADWTEHCSTEIEITTSNFTAQADSRNVEHLSLTAFPSNREVALQWLTNTGFKVEQFEIERSIDGEIFTRVDRFVNKDWTTEIAYHQGSDQLPTNGINYYRVKQIYVDGSFDYTEVKTVDFTINLNSITVFPNPVEEELFISLKPYMGQQGLITLQNQFGQKVREIDLGTIKEEIIQIETTKLHNGIYYLNVQIDKQKNFTKKVLVHHLY